MLIGSQWVCEEVSKLCKLFPYRTLLVLYTHRVHVQDVAALLKGNENMVH